MSDDNERVVQKPPEEPVGEMSEAEIDNNLAQTFPASDPPSWTLGTDHKAELPDPEKENL
jgi:hypothetical protein